MLTAQNGVPVRQAHVGDTLGLPPPPPPQLLKEIAAMMMHQDNIRTIVTFLPLPGFNNAASPDMQVKIARHKIVRAHYITWVR